MTTTATEQISAVSVINMLGEIVDGHEDFVYDTEVGCVYFDGEGAPSCLVGHVLAAYGYTAQLFTDNQVLMDGMMFGNSARFEWVTKRVELPFTPAAVRVLDYAQTLQDMRRTWGEAYTMALAYFQDMHESETP